MERGWERVTRLIVPLFLITFCAALTFAAPDYDHGYRPPMGYSLTIIPLRDRPWIAVELPTEFSRHLIPVMQCESRFSPMAVGKAGERGLLQISPVHIPYLASIGYNFDEMFDPEKNLRAGVKIWERAGMSWRPWSCGELPLLN